jgi:Domain of unknown function (DUF4160)
VGKIDCIQIAGLRLWFNSSDHLPHHIHVTKTGEWEIRIYFLRCAEGRLDFDVKWGVGPPRKLRNELLAMILQNRVALLAEWERKVCTAR